MVSPVLPRLTGAGVVVRRTVLQRKHHSLQRKHHSTDAAPCQEESFVGDFGTKPGMPISFLSYSCGKDFREGFGWIDIRRLMGYTGAGSVCNVVLERTSCFDVIAVQ